MTKELVNEIENDYWNEKADPIDMAEVFDLAIKALEQEPILDKVRSEIEEHAQINQNLNTDRARALCWCLDVIDKYKAESEDEK